MAQPLAPIEKALLTSLRESGMLAPGDRVGVAVSGGADSVALLRLLHALRARLGVTLMAVHFDHCLRGAASEEDARFVADLARSLSLECIVDREDVRAAARRHKWNLEDAGRRLRYAFFERLAVEKRVDCMAVAHTADDQAETVLARLIRGTGPGGLAAIYPVVASGAGRIVRPLLGHRRLELRDHLDALDQPWREDATNQDLDRTRARIRRRLVPLLETEFSPRIVDHLANLARLSREQEIFWDALADDALARFATITSQRASIAVSDLLEPFPRALGNNSAPALTARLIRKLYGAIRGDLRDLTSVQVEQVIRLAARSTSGHRVELPGGISVRRDFGQLTFFAAGRRLKATKTDTIYAYTLHLPERGSAAALSVPELHTQFLLKVIDWPQAQRETRMDTGALDAERLTSPLILRNWRPGDSYRPRERHRSRKLKEMLREARIARGERGAWPVLESCGRVAWARGLPPAGDFCAHDGTRIGVVIECGMHDESEASANDAVALG